MYVYICELLYMYIYRNVVYNTGKIEKVYSFQLQRVGEKMATSEAQKKASINYAKKALKRIPLDVPKEKYDEIKAAADHAGETVNGFIKKAIDERIKRENKE